MKTSNHEALSRNHCRFFIYTAPHVFKTGYDLAKIYVNITSNFCNINIRIQFIVHTSFAGFILLINAYRFVTRLWYKQENHFAVLSTKVWIACVKRTIQYSIFLINMSKPQHSFRFASTACNFLIAELQNLSSILTVISTFQFVSMIRSRTSTNILQTCWWSALHVLEQYLNIWETMWVVMAM